MRVDPSYRADCPRSRCWNSLLHGIICAGSEHIPMHRHHVAHHTSGSQRSGSIRSDGYDRRYGSRDAREPKSDIGTSGRDTASIDRLAQSSLMLAGTARMNISVPIHTFCQQMFTSHEVFPGIGEHCATEANVRHRTAVWQLEPRTRLAGSSRVILVKHSLRNDPIWT